MDVSIILVNYNTTQLVIDCINSIYEKTKFINFEIIVVDNNSPDRSIENIKTIFPDIKLIFSERNRGFGGGNNLGNKNATGKYLFFLNSDTLLIHNTVLDFFNFMENTHDAGACGGNLLTKELKPNISFERIRPSLISSINRLFFNIFTRLMYKNQLYYSTDKKPIIINGYISGADFFVSKKIFDKVKGFDEDFFMYYEETELSYRINNLGLKFYILPYVKIIHLEGGSQKNNSSNKIKWMRESRKIYYEKTSNKLKNITYFIDSINDKKMMLVNKILNYIK